jgi:hypothetical protein
MNTEWLYGVSQWIAYPVAAVLIFAAAEFGCWLGMRSTDRNHEQVRSHITTIQSALLGLLALLIGFTFSIALSRYDARRALVLGEANAIGTTALRAQFLSEGHAAKAIQLLKDYTDTRFVYTPTDDGAPVTSEVRGQEFLTALWAEAVFATGQDPKSVPVGLFVQSLNDVIDFNEKRRIANRNRVPEVTFLLLFAMASVASGFTGYSAGLGGTRQHIPNAIMALSIAIVIMLIADLDRPKRGLITVDQQALTDVKNSFSK